MSRICGKEWGAYPTDEELGFHYLTMKIVKKNPLKFPSLCTKKCKEEVLKSSNEIVNEIFGEIMETVDEYIENEEEECDYYTKTYGVVPKEWRDKEGNLIGMVYKSNSDITRRLWGDSLTIRMDSDEEEEYSDGEAIDDRNERQYYFH